MIVNADDYGHSAGVSKGIRECHLNGMVTSTTAMMNMPGVEEALQQAQRECPQLGLGVHLILTAGRPVASKKALKSLVLEDGSFPDESGMISRLAALDPDEARMEWQAQIDKFISAAGCLPDHLDSHHHISFLSPVLFEIMLELAQKHGCAIRFPSGEAAVDMLGDFPPERALETLEKNLRLVDLYNAAHPDHFIKSFYGEKATFSNLEQIITNLPEGCTEIMCHPGYPDDELKRHSVYHEQRAGELAILTGSGILEIVNQFNIELVNFSALIRN